MLRAGQNELLPEITALFNACLVSRSCPPRLALASKILLSKTGDTREMNNLKPIALLSTIFKLLTKTVGRRLENRLDEAQPDEQTGFRRGYSTVDNIFVVKQVISKAQEYNFPLVLVFVDFEKAFDTVETNAVLAALQQQGGPRTTNRLTEGDL